MQLPRPLQTAVACPAARGCIVRIRAMLPAASGGVDLTGVSRQIGLMGQADTLADSITAATDLPTSDVPALPPMSGVRGPSASTISMA